MEEVFHVSKMMAQRDVLIVEIVLVLLLAGAVAVQIPRKA